MPSPDRDPPSSNCADEHNGKACCSAIPLRILRQSYKKIIIAREVVYHRRHHHSRHLPQSELPAHARLTWRLKAEQDDGDEMVPVDFLAYVLEPGFDDGCLDEDGGEQETQALDHK